LCLSIAGFADASSERMKLTYRRLCERLDAGDSLLYRNLPDDGIPVEGAFGICGFWRVQFIALGGGSLAEAEEAFEALLKTANDLGLLGEETDPATGAVLGNFPQAFTHIGLINAALAIEERRTKEAKS
jgi:GH15 family glucan-1,4-alpha-glucosidase